MEKPSIPEIMQQAYLKQAKRDEAPPNARDVPGLVASLTSTIWEDNYVVEALTFFTQEHPELMEKHVQESFEKWVADSLDKDEKYRWGVARDLNQFKHWIRERRYHEAMNALTRVINYKERRLQAIAQS